MTGIFQRAFWYSIMVLIFSMSIPNASTQDSNSAWQRVDAILQRIHPPVFPDIEFSVADYGACTDGQTDCRPAFVAAIRACVDAGGGRVVVPEGEYLINGPLHLDDNINLHLEKGSVLRFGTNPQDYLVGDERLKECVKVRWEGVWCYNYSPLIYAWKAKNVALTGKGTIDGQTDKFWSRWYIEKLHAPDREILYQMPLDMTPMEQRIFGPGHHLAPGTIEFYHCENVLIEGITTRMPLERTIHPVFCTNVIVRNVTVQPGVEKARNDDGIDPDSCIDVLIENCVVHTYDDGIAVKSGRAREGWPENGGRPTENVVIRNNVFLGGHNGVSAGSDMSGGIRNIFVENCKFGVEEPQWAVFNAKSNCDRGGVIEKIYFRNIEVGTCRHLIRMETDYKNVHYDSIDHPFPPVFRDMIFQDIICKETLDEAFFIEGLVQEPVRDILLKDITILKANGPEKKLKYVENIKWMDIMVRD